MKNGIERYILPLQGLFLRLAFVCSRLSREGIVCTEENKADTGPVQWGEWARAPPRQPDCLVAFMPHCPQNPFLDPFTEPEHFLVSSALALLTDPKHQDTTVSLPRRAHALGSVLSPALLFTSQVTLQEPVFSWV